MICIYRAQRYSCAQELLISRQKHLFELWVLAISNIGPRLVTTFVANRSSGERSRRKDLGSAESSDGAAGADVLAVLSSAVALHDPVEGAKATGLRIHYLLHGPGMLRCAPCPVSEYLPCAAAGSCTLAMRPRCQAQARYRGFGTGLWERWLARSA